jgi:hypothetical protein
MKRILLLMGMLLVVLALTRCMSPSSPLVYSEPVNECEYPESLTLCYQQERSYHQPIFSKVCECINDGKARVILDFGCTRNYPFCDFTIEHKKMLAEKGYQWYCVCNETYAEYLCEDTNRIDKCNIQVFEGNVYERNRMTDFTWSY